MDNSTNGIEHHVRQGETLSAIAEQNGITLDDLLAANPDIEDPDLIQVNQVIIVPAQATPEDEPSQPTGVQPPAGMNETEDAGTFFRGFDRLAYPGNDFMGLLRTQAQVAWTGFYLAPAPSQGNTSWMQKRAFLKDLGYGFA